MPSVKTSFTVDCGCSSEPKRAFGRLKVQIKKSANRIVIKKPWPALSISCSLVRTCAINRHCSTRIELLTFLWWNRLLCNRRNYLRFRTVYVYVYVWFSCSRRSSSLSGCLFADAATAREILNASSRLQISHLHIMRSGNALSLYWLGSKLYYVDIWTA